MQRGARSVRCMRVGGASGLVAALIVAIGLLTLSPSPASAFRGHAFASDFGWGVSDGKAEAQICSSGCKAGLAGSVAGQFSAPSDVAVNEATGHVYVLDQANARIEVFGHDEKFISQFDGSETPAKAFSFGTVALSGGIAVDNACYVKKLSGSACTTADPSNGDVYVTDPGNRVVDKFSAEGVYLGQLQEDCGSASCPAFEFTALAGVAVDADGVVWAYQPGLLVIGDVDSFTKGEPNMFASTRRLENIPGTFVCPGFAVDAEDNLYARKAGNSPVCSITPEIFKFATSGHALITPFAPEEASAVAVDLASDEVFLDNTTSIGAFSPEAVQQERFGDKGEVQGGAGLTVNHENASDSTVYVADTTANRIDVFGPEPPGVPIVFGQSVSSVTANSARLEAEVNPHGASTAFHFEYGRCATPSTCASSPFAQSIPVPDGFVGADFEVHSVSANPQDLQASAVYHFRVVAHNELGEAVAGEEQSFTTQTPGVFELPDGRGWELVSPPDKHGALLEPIAETGVVQAAVGGQGISYVADAPTEADPQGNALGSQILSLRANGRWSAYDIAPPHEGATGQPVGNGQEYRFFSSDLSQSAVQQFGAFTHAISSHASEQTPYLRTLYFNGNPAEPCLPSSMECFRPLVSACPEEGEECPLPIAEEANAAPGSVFGEEGLCPPAQLCGPVFVGATSDLRHIVLNSKAPLLEASVTRGLYEWSEGQLSLLSVLPEGEGGGAVAGVLGDRSGENSRNAISDDGSRVVWMTNGGQPHLYLRDRSREVTLRLDEGLSGTPEYQGANAEVSEVFFTEEGDLYQYNVQAEERQQLTSGADIVGTLSGISEDGGYMYFAANGKLAGAEGAVSGSCVNGFKGNGQCNLYVLHEGQLGLVAVLSSEDNPDWAKLKGQTARVSPDGRYLAFMSNRSLTGYDNRDALSAKRDEEVYLYDAQAGKLSCASCDPSGARPRGVEYASLGALSLVGGDRVWQKAQWLAANIPGWTAYSLGQALYQSRYLSDSGRLFFNSNEALVPQDVNGTWDVYQSEPPGIGSCATTSPSFDQRSGACVAAISSGTSPEESAFLDASQDGSDVFFLTASQLSRSQDRDTALDIYDAHVCSASLPCITEPATPPPPCSTEASCRAAPTPQPDIFGAPPSATFAGIGNVLAQAPAPKPPKSNAQKLKEALAACHKQHKHSKKKRTACERKAKARYAPKKHAKAKRRGKR